MRMDRAMHHKKGGLHVDDNESIRDTLQMALETEGYNVLSAANGEEGLQVLARESRPFVILLDLMMPIMDGAALVEAMRADPQLADVPVVIMSSMPEATVAERSPSYVAFLRKPFNIFAVVDLIAKLTKSQR